MFVLEKVIKIKKKFCNNECDKKHITCHRGTVGKENKRQRMPLFGYFSNI